MNEKKLKIPTQREAEELTGLQAGGISPLALINHGFQMVLDESAMGFSEINISGGQRGLNIRLGVKDLLKLINCRTAHISSPLEE
jgi:Cys-tRNA(Pro)/Cys-tRNA(Cys) deacylase